MKFSQLSYLIVLFLFFNSDLNAASNWNERIKNIVPEFIADWWWPEKKGVNSDLDVATLAALPHAQDWLEKPKAYNNNSNFHWPLESLTPSLEQQQLFAAKQTTKIMQDKFGCLPITLGIPIRLISRQRGIPEFFQQYLQSFALVKTLNYERSRDQVFIGSNSAQLLDVLYVRAEESSDENGLPWYHDFKNQSLVLIYEGDYSSLKIHPDNWIIISTQGGNAATELLTARRLFEGQNMDVDVLSYANPLTVGVDPDKLSRVDYQIKRAIWKRATPGAQLLVAKNGKIIYQKSYGYHTYRRQQEVYTSDLYDLASVTKAAATSLAVMYLFDKSKLELDKRVSDYLPNLKNRAAGRYSIAQLLTHQTGLQSNLPVQQYLGRTWVSEAPDDNFTIPLSPERWLDKRIPAKVIEGLKDVNYTRRPVYRYSDVNYTLLQQIVEAIDGRSMDQLLMDEVYQPMGLSRLTYLPYERFGAEQCVPTTTDEWMRGGLLRAYVHDEGAAMLGGVAGHAGLFASATDLAQLFQMLINKGAYNGRQIFTQSTVELFTSRSQLNYRALGFDRLAAGWPGVIQVGASNATFGHTGFSGTCVWADPDNELVFVLLTNRIHPTTDNKKLSKMNTRAKTHVQVYRSIIAPSA